MLDFLPMEERNMSVGALRRFLYFLASLLLLAALCWSWHEDKMETDVFLVNLVWIPLLWGFIVFDYQEQKFDEEWKAIDKKYYGN